MFIKFLAQHSANVSNYHDQLCLIRMKKTVVGNIKKQTNACSLVTCHRKQLEPSGEKEKTACKDVWWGGRDLDKTIVTHLNQGPDPALVAAAQQRGKPTLSLGGCLGLLRGPNVVRLIFWPADCPVGSDPGTTRSPPGHPIHCPHGLLAQEQGCHGPWPPVLAQVSWGPFPSDVMCPLSLRVALSGDVSSLARAGV